MPRKLLAGFVAFVILVVLGTSLLIALTSPRQAVPQFARITPSVAASQISYDFLNPRPFQSDKMWIAAGREVTVPWGWGGIACGAVIHLVCCWTFISNLIARATLCQTQLTL
jgi:hypothetical protein